jgi:hypothetical protein
MQKIFFLTLVSLLTLVAASQKLGLNAYGSYMFDGGFESNYDPNTFFAGAVNSGDQWEAGFEYILHPDYCFEIQYLHQTTTVPYTYKLSISSEIKSESPKLDVDGVMFGSDGHLSGSSGKVEGYAGLFLGVGHLQASDFSSGNAWSADKFSMGTRLGCNVWVMDKLGFKFQA